MPTSKTDADLRLPDPAAQQRGLQNTTQNQAATSRLQDTSRSAGEAQGEDMTSRMTLQELLQTRMDKDGNPVSDPVAFTDGAKMQESSQALDEADLVDAAYYDDFD
ncbi:hypothetical protein ABOM_010305 [Aspergillus bombycis]|uniref:Uncharacterized protein n=1 Tax=Aspergillus bombycis TaxID=109264 RepID=A0A1F7ZNL6_9EURO|nr:hypothetical protein ABOM_010305 [Aspergillus bombycis]OGM41021.1 hypothetical protein ABOM_010305 [Aspergillus bombycis]